MTENRNPFRSGDTLNNPRLRALLRYWNEKRGDKPMPARNAIDPLEIPRLLSVTLLADVVQPYPKIRLLGTDATTAYGAETRGWTIDRFQFGHFTSAWIEAFSIVTREHIPAAAAGSYMTGAQFSLIETVLLPLSDDVGSMTYIFGGLLITPSQQNPLTVPTESIAYVSSVSVDSAPLKSECRGG
jgi:hypothetical protein